MAENPLSPNEAALLRVAPDAPFTVADVLAASGLREAQAEPAAEALRARGLLEREEAVSVRLVLAEAGRAQAQGGVPELLIRARLREGPRSIQEAQDLPGLPKAAIGSAFGGLKKAGLVRVAGGQVSLAEGPGWAVHEGRAALLGALAEREGGLPWVDLEGHPGRAEQHAALVAASAEWQAFPAELLADVEARLPGKRGKQADALFAREETRTRTYRLSAAGQEARRALGEARREVAQLTPDMLKDGSWREVEFRRFNIAAPPALPIGRRDPYRAFLDLVKLKLLGLGFEEMTGPLVEAEFWNMDALFLPQFHPAREVHDVYFVEDAAAGGGRHAYAQRIEAEGGAEGVAREHEGAGSSGSLGWGYAFDRERTKRLVLRSQGTALSARWLRAAKRPGKYFGMARCFRYDTVDATHAPDFFQVEGIVVSERTSFRHLLGLLKVFAYEVARAREVVFVPGYFPFTEPSVEVHMKHPTLGWVELGGAGIFRPEVTRPHGVDVPVIAWGLGLDRMAMVALGIDDIRHLFTNNIPDGLAGLRQRIAR